MAVKEEGNALKLGMLTVLGKTSTAFRGLRISPRRTQNQQARLGQQVYITVTEKQTLEKCSAGLGIHGLPWAGTSGRASAGLKKSGGKAFLTLQVGENPDPTTAGPRTATADLEAEEDSQVLKNPLLT